MYPLRSRRSKCRWIAQPLLLCLWRYSQHHRKDGESFVTNENQLFRSGCTQVLKAQVPGIMIFPRGLVSIKGKGNMETFFVDQVAGKTAQSPILHEGWWYYCHQESEADSELKDQEPISSVDPTTNWGEVLYRVFFSIQWYLDVKKLTLTLTCIKQLLYESYSM